MSFDANYDEFQDTFTKLNLSKIDEKRRISSATTIRKNLFMKEEELSRKWAVGKQIAHDTL
jgi:hypothetical protein